MTATLAEVLAAVAREHREDGSFPDTCVCEEEVAHDREGHFAAHLAAEQSRAVAEWLRSEDVQEVAARSLARLEPGEDWPTNDALGGSLTGTRDDEYRDGLRDEAGDLLDAVAGLCGGEGS